MSEITIQTLLSTSTELYEQVTQLCNELSFHSRATTPQHLDNANLNGRQGPATELHSLWKPRDVHDATEKAKAKIVGLAQKLQSLTLGPQGFIHELVSINWEHGALYAALEHGVLDAMPMDGSTRSLQDIASLTGLLPSKLLPLCRLLACSGIITEVEAGKFGHTFVSNALSANKGFRSWVGFQLYETRLASANLADWLKQPCEFYAGPAAFDLAFGMPMHRYHTVNVEKGTRFFHAMNSVAQDGLDAGNEMVFQWLKSRSMLMTDPKTTVVVVAGKSIGAFAERMAALFQEVRFELRDTVPSEVNVRENHLRRLFLLYGVLWVLDDQSCLVLLRKFVPLLLHASRPTLLVCDLVSPEKGHFEPHVELAFRRRDVTLMTMHNAQQRTSKQWLDLMLKADRRFAVKYTERHKSHSCRGMWEIQICEQIRP